MRLSQVTGLEQYTHFYQHHLSLKISTHIISKMASAESYANDKISQ